MSDRSADEEDRTDRPVVGRRSWLGKVGLATGVAVVGSQLLPDAAAQAANGDPITAGNYTGSSGTTQLVDSNSETAFWSVARTTAGIPFSAAVVGDSADIAGVAGLTGVGVGVIGISGGASGLSLNGAVAGDTDLDYKSGVIGSASGFNSVGVTGLASDASGMGVYGDAPYRGVYGRSTAANGVGVEGNGSDNNSSGVYGSSSTVSGSTHIAGVVGDSSANAGVAGLSRSSTGVYGSATASGGIGGSFTGSGGALAFKATGTSSFAGVTTFSRSGKLSIASGATSATKTGVGLGPNALVMTTIQGGAPGNSVSNVVINSTSSFTINLVSPASGTVIVGWFIVN